MTLKASHILAAGFVAIAGMAAQALITNAGQPSVQLASGQTVVAVEAVEPSPSKAYAEEHGLQYHKTGNSYSVGTLSHYLTLEAPSFDRMKMVEGETIYSPNGVSKKEVYTIDLYVHETDAMMLATKHKIYSNECSVIGDEIASQITFAHIDRPYRVDHDSAANDNEALAIQAQKQCRVLARNGHLEAFKEHALASSAAN